MSKFSITPTEIKRFVNGSFKSEQDVLSVEEPLEIRVAYNNHIHKIAVTMRTPGNDEYLSVGFLFSEGLIEPNSREMIQEVQVINHPEEGQIATVFIDSNYNFSPKTAQRNFYTTSSCGVCGKASIDLVRTACETLNPQNAFEVKAELLLNLPQLLRDKQASFDHTGGIHASALYNIKSETLDLFEDVGRHNALDKLIGYKWLNKVIPINDSILLLSGRASFELIQKAGMAGISIVCAIGAPSSLAVDLAEDLKICLVGFLKENKFNIYSESHRIVE